MENNIERQFDAAVRAALMKKVEGWLTERDFGFSPFRKAGFVLPFGTSVDQISVHVIVADTFLVFLASLECECEPSAVAQMLAAINSWNFSRPLGSFQLDKESIVNYRYWCDDLSMLSAESLEERILHCAIVIDSKVAEIKRLCGSEAPAAK